ncbi:hypothetical protein WMZ97_06165 [Lentibacillus sp. N15]|uniref:hypothetical protein n=1 Tax=Lentibacillus songyuanensis TaxID=3136161 RepID=UPI0031BA3C29
MLHIPKLDSDLPFDVGTNEDKLEKGVGHDKGTVYPRSNVTKLSYPGYCISLCERLEDW